MVIESLVKVELLKFTEGVIANSLKYEKEFLKIFRLLILELLLHLLVIV